MSYPAKPTVPAKALTIFLTLGMFALTACVAPAPLVRIRISSGERLVVNLRDGRVEGSDSNLVKVVPPRFLVSPQTKTGVYTFGVAFLEKAEPASIRVEDVTDEKAHLLIQDDAPVLTGRLWLKTTPAVDMNSDAMKWMHDIDDSYRVYAFHVTLKDGQKVLVYQAAVYFGFFKQNMMQMLGADEKKP